MQSWGIAVVMLVVAGTALCRSMDFNRLPMLHRLVYKGQQTEIARLLPQLKDYLNDRDIEGHTPLHWAVYMRDTEMVKFLLQHGADPNIYDDHGSTSLHNAAGFGTAAMVGAMLENGGDPTSVSGDAGHNALLMAAHTGKADAMLTLMHHVDPAIRGKDGMDIFALAVQGDDPDKMTKIKLLLDAGVQPDIGLTLLLTPPAEIDRVAKLLASYEEKVPFNTDNINVQEAQHLKTALIQSAIVGSVSAVQILLKHGAQVNKESKEGFNAIAATHNTEGQREVAQLLLAHGIRVDNASGRVAFLNAVQRDDKELAWLLLEQVTYGEKDNNPVPAEWFYVESQAVVDIAGAEMQQLLREYGADSATAPAPTTKARPVDPQQWRDPKGLPEFLLNLNKLAAQGKFKPVIGRDNEIEQVITALARKEKNNPMLVGEAGVGKTAVVEGLAQRIVLGDVPPMMRNKNIFALDMGALIGGTILQGQLEERISELQNFIAKSDNAVLFIDEVHQLLSSPVSATLVDMLKPALARGDLHCIGATTHAEYQRHIMQDKALERRFLPVTIDEPSQEDTFTIVNGVKDSFAQYHRISISDDAVQAAVTLADRYITDRYQPDKAIDVLDLAAAKLAVHGNKDMVLQREHVAEVVAEITGVPQERMLLSKQDKVSKLLPFLRANIFGQDKVLQQIEKLLIPSMVGIGDQNRPVSMLLLGPTGVGKTETAKVLAEYLFGDQDNLIDINLSEYRERQRLVNLTGAPKSFVGYGEGGVLTEAVRKKPFSVLLFDELGEAHPDFAGILLKILDEGELDDSMGRTINFRNTIIIITGNTAASNAARRRIGFSAEPQSSPSAAAASEVHIKDKVQGRLGGILTYESLGPEVMGKLIDKQLRDFNARLQQKNISISLTKTLRQHLSKEGYSRQLGARPLLHAFEQLVANPIAMHIAIGKIKEGHYRIGWRNEEITIRDTVKE